MLETLIQNGLARFFRRLRQEVLATIYVITMGKISMKLLKFEFVHSFVHPIWYEFPYLMTPDAPKQNSNCLISSCCLCVCAHNPQNIYT